VESVRIDPAATGGKIPILPTDLKSWGGVAVGYLSGFILFIMKGVDWMMKGVDAGPKCRGWALSKQGCERISVPAN
jgi:hypothetical protein